MEVKICRGVVINTIAYEPLKGSSYIPLPPILSNKKAIGNIKNTDDLCFFWSMARALNDDEEHPERITKELREQTKTTRSEGY